MGTEWVIGDITASDLRARLVRSPWRVVARRAGLPRPVGTGPWGDRLDLITLSDHDWATSAVGCRRVHLCGRIGYPQRLIAVSHIAVLVPG